MSTKLGSSGIRPAEHDASTRVSPAEDALRVTHRAPDNAPAAVRLEAAPAEHGSVAALGAVTRRGSLRQWSTAALLAALLAAALWWLYDRLTHVVLTDARVTADMILISSRVPGWITDIPIRKGDFLKSGDLLVQIDDRDARFRLAEAEAQLGVVEARIGGARSEISLVEGTTSSRVDAQRSRLDAAASAVASAAAKLVLARSELARSEPLKHSGLLSQREWDERRTAFQSAEQDHLHAKADLKATQASLGETQAARGETQVKDGDLQVLLRERDRLLAVRDRLAGELADHAVRSPLDGVLDEGFVHPGEFVQTGQRMLVMHDRNQLWVRANAKETEIRFIEVGQPAEIVVDAYPDQIIKGTVSRVGDAATSQFSLLPNPNPSGNFTKIAQRIEVRIELPEQEVPLKPGMMVEVRLAK